MCTRYRTLSVHHRLQAVPAGRSLGMPLRNRIDWSCAATALRTESHESSSGLKVLSELVRETTSNARTTEQILFKCSRFRRIRSTQCSSSCLQSLPTTWGLGFSAPFYCDQVHIVSAVRRPTSAIDRELCTYVPPTAIFGDWSKLLAPGSEQLSRSFATTSCRLAVQLHFYHRLQGSTKTRGLMRYWKLTNLLVWGFSKEHAVNNLCNPCN